MIATTSLSASAVRGDEGHIVDASLSEIRTEVESPGAVAIIRECGIGRNIDRRQGRDRRIRIGRGGAEVKIGTLGNTPRTDSRQHRTLIAGINYRDRYDFAVSKCPSEAMKVTL